MEVYIKARGYGIIIIISAIAGKLLKFRTIFFGTIFFSDIEYLLKNSDILFGSEYKREI